MLGFGCFMGALAVMLNIVGVSLGWMYLAMGVIIGSAVLPIAFLLHWRKANAIGAMASTILGCILGIITWLSVTQVLYGRVNLDTTGRDTPMLVGNSKSILVGGLVHAVCSFLKPQNYDWETTKQITTVEMVKEHLPDEEFKEEKLVKAKWWIVKWGIGFTILIVVLWPVLSLPAKRFILGYFTFWAIIAIAWGTIASAVIIVMPLVESWDTIQTVFAGLFTNQRLYSKIDELDMRLRAIVRAIPEAEKLYLSEKGKEAKKFDLVTEDHAIDAASV